MTSVRGTIRILIHISTVVLPTHGVRERYQREHLGEVSALCSQEQFRYAWGALASSWALRQAVLQEQGMTITPTRPPKPLLCRLNLHHRWRPERSPDGQWYRRCANCGKDDPGSFIEKTVDLIGPGGGGGIGGGG